MPHRFMMQAECSHSSLKWFAARAIVDRPYVLKYLECMGIEFSRIADIPNLLFLHCTRRTIFALRSELYDRVLFYKDPKRLEVQEVPERNMRSFLILAPFHGKPVIYLPVDDPAFFDGPCFKVLSGEFAGCEGTLKRIKGEKRLIIKVSDHAAIATPHIPARLLERMS